MDPQLESRTLHRFNLTLLRSDFLRCISDAASSDLHGLWRNVAAMTEFLGTWVAVEFPHYITKCLTQVSPAQYGYSIISTFETISDTYRQMNLSLKCTSRLEIDLAKHTSRTLDLLPFTGFPSEHQIQILSKSA
ncbi:hypothetical protein B0H13DRAFT_1885984 [Mycena leptocephala]|nr:hypothetical protein B0H13DRAFT_1885984 [Mycena leptocephala]